MKIEHEDKLETGRVKVLRDFGACGGLGPVFRAGEIISYPWIVYRVECAPGFRGFSGWGVIDPNRPKFGRYDFVLEAGVDAEAERNEQDRERAK